MGKKRNRSYLIAARALLEADKYEMERNEQNLIFSLCVIRTFGFAKKETFRMRSILEECQSIRRNVAFIKLCKEKEIPFPWAEDEQKNKDMQEAAQLCYEYSNEPLKIKLVCECINLVNDMMGWNFEHTAWNWKEVM